MQEDLTLRSYLRNRLPKDARVAKIAIERIKKEAEVITITIHTARPGIVIGRKGKDVDQLREELKKLTGKEIRLNISEIKSPEMDSYLVATDIARQLESQIPYRRAMKNATRAAMRMGAEGIRVAVSGRLGGAEMARAIGIMKAACLCIPCAPISILPMERPKPPTDRSASKCGSAKAKCSARLKPSSNLLFRRP